MSASLPYRVTTALPPRRPDYTPIVLWLVFVWAVSFTLAHAVLT